MSTETLGAAEATANARERLDAAQTAHDDHAAKLAKARVLSDSLLEDASGVNQSQFTSAQNTLAYLEASLPGVERDLATAKQGYATAVAAQVSAEVGSEAATRWGLDELPGALSNLAGAVSQVRAICEAYNAGRVRAIASLLDAGLEHGSADPFAPATAERAKVGSPARLYVEGTEVGVFDIPTYITKQVATSLADLTTEGA
ncbi:hypothetical protein H7F30_12995 [Dermacoccus sp. PAMC28757]|uniref:hypothetical protein n=1 Tax=Dermacoccus sp. PAMC28757 TaxID=2762331 RepID=UPI00164EA9FC|nr:hypothetical protein [Dermacoccus sp. PAMC28757]QNK52489.1 hypothetical protein H7F30_12995 [Dermacoccus sp. PAMC28757]